MNDVQELKGSIENLGRDWETFKKTNNERLKKLEERKGVADFEEKLDKISTGMKEQEDRIEKFQVALNRGPGAKQKSEGEEKQKELKEVMSHYLRKGDRNLSDEQEQLLVEHAKSLSSDSDPSGGFFVRSEVANEIQKTIFESSPMRQLCDVQSISTNALEIHHDGDEPDCNWQGERETTSNTDTPDTNLITIPVHTLEARPKATQNLLDDASIDIEAWLQQKVMEKFGRTEATGFVSGDGVKKPLGFLSYAAGTSFNQIEQQNSGHASLLTADGFHDVQGLLKEAYQMNAVWLMKRASATAARKLKDSDNRYLFSLDASAGLNGGPSFSLLGKPLHYADDMPAVAANALSVAYGDFKKGYQIVDRIGIRVLRDPYTAKPFIEFYSTKRVGGGVKMFEAIKIMKIAA